MTSWRPLSHAELLEQCDPRFLAALTAHNNGPLPDEIRTLGPQQVRWIRKNTRLGEGDRYAKAPELTPEQQALVWKLAEILPDGRRRFGFALMTLGKGSGKSPFGGWIGSVDLAGPAVTCTGCAKCDKGFRKDGTPHAARRVSPDVLVLASSYEQADLILDEIRTTFTEGPLAPHADAMKGLVELKTERGSARRRPATVKQVDGSKATVLLCDELHEFDTDRKTNAFDVAAGGTAKRQDGLILVMSTAGWDLNSLFGRMVARGRRGEFGQDELFLCMEADETLDPTSDTDIAEGIRQCNPLAARGVVSVSAMVKQFKAMPVFRAMRYFWNRWVPTDAAWLPLGAWDACKGNLVFDPSLPTWIGVDMALKRDSAAVVAVQRREDGKLQSWAKVWLPDGNLIDQSECDDYLRALVNGYNVVWIAVDEAWWPTLTTLEEEGLPIFRMPQQGRNMIVAYGKTYRAIVDQVLLHDGDPVYSDQIASAAPHTSDRGWTLKKGKTHRRIDCCPALAGAIFASELAAPEAAKPAPWYGVL